MLFLSDGLRDCEDPECCENKDCQSNQVESTKYTQTQEGAYNCAPSLFSSKYVVHDLSDIINICSMHIKTLLRTLQLCFTQFLAITTITITITIIIMMRHCSCATRFPARSTSCFKGSPPHPQHPSSKRF